MKNFIVIIVCILLSFKVFSQDLNQVFAYSENFKNQNANELRFNLRTNSFFRNNEFFNTIFDGYTLTGFAGEPVFSYKPAENLTIESGIRLLKFWGTKLVDDISPIFSVHYFPVNDLQISLGTITCEFNHQLIEPLYFPDNYFINKTENGIQIKFKFKRLTSDFWLDWQKFIKPGENHQEQLASGSVSEILLSTENKNFRFSIPVQTYVTHRGGQINTDNLPLQTIFNSATGIKLSCKLSSSLCKELIIKSLFTQFFDLSPQKKLLFTQGNGLYSEAYLSFGLIRTTFSHWITYNYYSPNGNPLFCSLSTEKLYFRDNTRNLISSKIALQKEINDLCRFDLRFEGIYDCNNKVFDYLYALHLIVCDDFFVAKKH